MVTVDFSQEKRNVLIGILMIVLALALLLFMGSSMVHSTRDFWTECPFTLGE